MRLTIQTPEGPRTVPDWATCYCVSNHRPHYIHPYPYALPSGDELWLCPNTFHQANTLLNLYMNLDGPPKGTTLVKFNYFVRSLITMHWQQLMEMKGDEEAWREAHLVRIANQGMMSEQELSDFIKKVEAHG